MNEILVGGKSEELNPGYVFAPYIPMQTMDICVDNYGRKTMRKSKINKIFNLELDVKCESPTSIASRYSKKICLSILLYLWLCKFFNLHIT